MVQAKKKDVTKNAKFDWENLWVNGPSRKKMKVYNVSIFCKILMKFSISMNIYVSNSFKQMVAKFWGGGVVIVSSSFYVDG